MTGKAQALAVGPFRKQAECETMTPPLLPERVASVEMAAAIL
jgi:hypothetical protein